ncbi:hypothetical protein ABEB36_011531 [Hypothenemus hampei]|uniref:Uncharacterized protein n=1 Tax=Hypothenemus hampei TaxID=57062 RepID=A0ABD1E919_HYPHA
MCKIVLFLVFDMMITVKMFFCFVFLFLGFVRESISSSPHTSSTKLVNICDIRELTLQSQGRASTNTINLKNPTEDHEACLITIAAPKSHVVNLAFLTDNDVYEEDKQQQNNTTNIKDSTNRKWNNTSRSCILNIFLPDNPNTPYWKADLCSNDEIPDIDLLTSEFKIIWSPPEDNATRIAYKSFVVTAIGSGPFCKDPFQHTCMRIGRLPMLCISEELLCDGIENCPKSSTNSDEDPKLCKTVRNAWENFVVELVKKYRPKDGMKYGLKLNSSMPNEWYEWQFVKKNGTKYPTQVLNETHSPVESISAMLNKYGPWGYLMMGLLICGTVLFFCGLWECCCKKAKTEVAPLPSVVPEAATTASTPRTFFIMGCNEQEENANVTPYRPPEYDDLDLPPSYTTLFPGGETEGRFMPFPEEEEEPITASGSGLSEKDNDECIENDKVNNDNSNDSSGDDHDDMSSNTSQQGDLNVE